MPKWKKRVTKEKTVAVRMKPAEQRNLAALLATPEFRGFAASWIVRKALEELGRRMKAKR